MKILKHLKSVIFAIISIGCIVIFFIHNYYDANLSTEQLPYALLYYVGVVILFFAITSTAHKLSLNSKSVLFEKYKIYKILNSLDKENKLNEFESFCVKKNNNVLKENIRLTLSVSKYKQLQNLVNSKNDAEIEKFLENLKPTRRKNVYKFLKSYNKPCYYEYFFSYHNHTIISTKSSVFGFLLTFISFVISIIPFFIKGFALLSFEAYLEFSVPIIITFIYSFSMYKSNIENICKGYSQDLKELVEDIDKFKK